MALSIFNSIEIAGLTTALPLNKKQFNKEYTFRKSIESQTTSDLGYEAAKRIIEQQNIDLNEIGVLIFISKTPDYRGPATAAVLQGRLNISIDCIAYDVNIGSSGFVYGSQIVCSNLESINKKYGLLIVGDTTTKQTNHNKYFGDGASAILFKKTEENYPIVIDTKAFSENYKSYMIEKGGFRSFKLDQNKNIFYDRSTNENILKIDEELFLKFVNDKVPNLINEFLIKNKIEVDSIDAIALHQFNDIALKLQSKVLGDKVVSNYKEYANTCGNTIPLLLSNYKSQTEKDNISVLASSFGEGLSIGVMSFNIDTNVISDIVETNNFFNDGFILHN